MTTFTPGEAMPMSSPEAWATSDDMAGLATVVGAMLAEAEATRHLVGVSVKAVDPDYLEMVGGHDRILFSRAGAGEPWTMTRIMQAPAAEGDVVNVRTKVRPLVSGAFGGVTTQKYIKQATVYSALRAESIGREPIDPLTTDECRDLSDQLEQLIPPRRRQARLAGAAALLNQAAA